MNNIDKYEINESIIDNVSIDNVKTKTVIEVKIVEGDGSKDNPFRNSLIFVTLDGKFIGKITS